MKPIPLIILSILIITSIITTLILTHNPAKETRDSIDSCTDNKLGYAVLVSNMTGKVNDVVCCVADTSMYTCRFDELHSKEN